MKKIIILCVICFFVGMGFQPAFANIVDNSPPFPEPPTIMGPDSGKPGQTLTYTFKASDPDGNDVRFHIDWGDGNSEWTNYVPQDTDKAVEHIWDVEDTYTITAYTQNEVGQNSSRTTKQVTIPRNKLEDCDCNDKENNLEGPQGFFGPGACLFIKYYLLPLAKIGQFFWMLVWGEDAGEDFEEGIAFLELCLEANCDWLFG